MKRMKVENGSADNKEDKKDKVSIDRPGILTRMKSIRSKR